MTLFGNSSKRLNTESERYLGLQNEIKVLALAQAREMGVDIRGEAVKIGELTNLGAKRKASDFYDVANFIIAEYPPELGMYIANAFTNFALSLGYDPYGKIMTAVQEVDRRAGGGLMTKISFIKEHPKFYEFMMERDCPERTGKAQALVATALFQFADLDFAKRVFPTLIVVPEMKSGIVAKLKERDLNVANAITGSSI